MKVYAVNILCVRKDGLVLGVCRRDTIDAWGLPGGKLDGNETVQECGARELYEETRLVSHPTRDLKQVFVRDDPKGPVVTVLASHWHGEPSQGDAGPVGWITWAILKQGPFGYYNTTLQRAMELRP